MTISPDLLSVGAEYSRSDLAELFDAPDIATSREGWYPRDRYPYVPFFVTLDKEKSDPAVAYNDYFEDGLFFWESQNRNTLHSKWIEKIVSEEVVPLLFVRKVAKIKGITQKFVYAGTLVSPLPDENSSKPVKFIFEPVDLAEFETEPLKSLIEWKPGNNRRKPLDGEYGEKVSRKRKKSSLAGQGFESNPLIRRAIELHAMELARKAYEHQGYKVEDVSGNHPYDLLCSQLGMRRRIEVKGTRGNFSVVNLTIGEVLAAREPAAITDLFIVYEIKVDASKSNPTATGGKRHLIQDWVPGEKDLEPTQYRYKVPSS